MHFRLSTQVIIFRLTLILSASAFVGFIFGYTLHALLLTCLYLLFWQYRHLLKLAEWLWQSKAISPPESEGLWGRVYDGLYRQIKQQRKKQRTLNEKVRRFRDGAEALPDAALVLSNELTIDWGNKKANLLLGIRWPSDVGQRIDNLIRAPEFSEYLDLGKYDSPCLLPSPVNSDIQLEIRLMAYGTEDVLLLARDISHIHRLEEMRKDFVANVSHELKTPLTVVRGYVEMIQTSENEFNAHWLKAFQAIEGQVTRMDRLVDQLLNLSRVEVIRDNESKKTVDMPKIILSLIDDSKWLNQDKNHVIEKNIDSNLTIKGFDTELKSACSNLLSNAIAYTPEAGRIEVSWEQQGSQAKFTVADNGPGIKPNDVKRLTERFYRVDKSRSRNTGGSGLGLAIVKHVLHHHNGELVINSTFGKGSEFSLIFNDAFSVTPLND